MKLFYEVIYDFILSLRGAQKFFGGLNQKYVQNLYLHWFWMFQTTSLKNVGGVGFLVNDT